MNTFIDDLKQLVLDEFSKHAVLIAGIIIGMILIGLYNRLIGERKMIKSYDTLIKAKNEHIDALNKVIYDKLKSIEVEKKDKAFFNKLKKLFKK